MEVISKKVGSQVRAEKAKKEMTEIFSDQNHPLYLEKDIYFAKKFDVTRLTIYRIREKLNTPPRVGRIVNKLKDVDTVLYTVRELAKIIGIKYQNLYKIVSKYDIHTKEYNKK